MLKRGSIPVTVFVVSVVVLFVFALLVLTLYNAQGRNDVVRGYSAVREFKIDMRNAEFLDGDLGTLEPVVSKEHGFLGFGEGVVSVEVRYIPES